MCFLSTVHHGLHLSQKVLAKSYVTVARGVLVNQLGPQAEQGRGEGYGGGGEGNTYGIGRGKVQQGAPGVVIMEIRLRED